MDHPLLARIKAIYDEDKEAPLLKDYSQLLFDMAVVSEGGKLDNPSRFNKMIGDLAANTLK
jgi:molecular chaperone HtpG